MRRNHIGILSYVEIRTVFCIAFLIPRAYTCTHVHLRMIRLVSHTILEINVTGPFITDTNQ